MASKTAPIKFSSYKRNVATTKARLEKILAAVTELQGVPPPFSSIQIRTIVNSLDETKRKVADYENVYNRILNNGCDEEENIDEVLSSDDTAIHELYIKIASIAESLAPIALTPTSPIGVGPLQAQSSVAQVNSVQLPKLALKTFNGRPESWMTFRNLYDTAVHRNTSLTNVIKFQYLLGALEGEPLTLIQSLNITPNNYTIAYDLLTSRYHNQRRLLTTHLNAILDLPALSANSVKLLRPFINAYYEHIGALRALGSDIATGINPLLSATLLRKLDLELRTRLENFRSIRDQASHTLPDAGDIMAFLTQLWEHNEDATMHSSPPTRRAQTSMSTPPKSSTQEPRKSFRSVTMTATENNDGKQLSSSTHVSSCFGCGKGQHRIYTCQTFLNLTPQERFKLVKSHQRCTSCLGNHSVKQCTSKNTCFKCNKRHHTLLHLPLDKRSVSPPVPADSNVVATSAQSLPLPTRKDKTIVVLGTTLIKLTATNGRTEVFRALLDSGSMCSFITQHAAQLLNAARHHTQTTIVGITNAQSRTRGHVELQLETLAGRTITPQHSFHILDKISANLPRSRISNAVLKMVKPYKLADPSFHLPGPIDVLIGASLYPQLLTHECHSLGHNLPYVIGTHFGFVVTGTAPCALETSSEFSSMLSTNDLDLHEAIQRFWTQEEAPASKMQSEEERVCDEHYELTHSRGPDGRYCVRLPFKVTPPTLGHSKLSAERRLRALERKQSLQPSFHTMYTAFLEEYEELGHMIKTEDLDLDSPHYFLPHHGVLKETSSTTKLRVVFDASAKSSSGLSLNDNLFVGPKLQADVCDILHHFRSHPIVVSCDIRQMYRQIRVHDEDQKYQLILWRPDTTQEIKTYKLTTVTYGVCTAPYHAIRTLRQLALDEGAAYPDAAKILLNQTYVDDIIFGADNVSDALTLRDQLIELLKLGGFELRKWFSNSSELLDTLPSDHLETPTFLQDSNQPQFSVLGIQWTPSTDSFSYQLNLPPTRPTKRSALSVIARIYDPCGFLSPCTMLAKCIMQLLWASGLSWDSPLPQELAEKWMTFISHLSDLSSLHIPRPLDLSASHRLELHGFADASECGYGAVVYLRSQDSSHVLIRLLLAKTRVAPLKRVTLPRLELCAALLLAKLAAHCISLFSSRINSKDAFLWSDSMIALTWLHTPSYRLKTYVANRVSQAQELMPSHCWRFVPSQDNPADCASRGLLASQLLDHSLWWTGPQWLSLPPDRWPDSSFTPQDLDASEETKKTPLAVLPSCTVTEDDFFARYGSWSTLLRVHAFVLRFIFNSRNPARRHGPLSTAELHEAHNSAVRAVQQSCFGDDINALRQKKLPSQKIRRLTPFLDDNKLLRVGGRLNHSSIASDAKHPLLLPHHHHVVDLLVDHWHRRQLHAGPLATQAALCQRYWILAARSLIRSRIHKCITCFRQKPRHLIPIMAPLPKVRVTPSRAFAATGIDYCGPFPCQIHRIRGSKQIKVYLCIFICMATKAIHIEVVTDLTTEGFLAALSRFTARRGFCSDIYSDCGTNFVGADAELRKIISSLRSTQSREEVHHFTSKNEVNFHFNPPSAPHFGGLWEAAVKSAKFHIRRVIGEQVLTLPELMTLTTHVEAVLNSRPLTPISSDPNDLQALSPGHFLVGAPLTTLPQEDFSNSKISRLSRFRLVQALQQNFWQRWQREYLHTLLQRQKWTQPAKNLQVGDLVLVQLPTPPLTWPLGRIIKVFPGSDLVTRAVEVKTARGVLKRPAVKLCPLPEQD